MLCGFCGHPMTSDVEETMKYKTRGLWKIPNSLIRLQQKNNMHVEQLADREPTSQIITNFWEKKHSMNQKEKSNTGGHCYPIGICHGIVQPEKLSSWTKELQ